MKKVNFVKQIMPVGKKIAGGFLGNQITTMVEKQSFAAENPMIAPAITLGLGIAGAIFAPQSMKDFADGIATVAGVELIESLTSESSGQTQGYKLGFVPQFVPEDAETVVTSDGGMIR